jgi:hypothetical protein
LSVNLRLSFGVDRSIFEVHTNHRLSNGSLLAVQTKEFSQLLVVRAFNSLNTRSKLRLQVQNTNMPSGNSSDTLSLGLSISAGGQSAIAASAPTEMSVNADQGASGGSYNSDLEEEEGSSGNWNTVYALHLTSPSSGQSARKRREETI